MFEAIIVRPLFNLLFAIYTYLPGIGFGLAIILLTIVIRFLLWPLVKRQLHQTRTLNELKPEIKKIKQSTKGDKQRETELIMELHKERGVNPLASVGMLFIQIPILVGLFIALRGFSNPAQIIHLPYDFVTNEKAEEILSSVAERTEAAIVAAGVETKAKEISMSLEGDIEHADLEALNRGQLTELYEKVLVDIEGAPIVEGPFFDQYLLGIIDLSRTAVEDGNIYWPLIGIALSAGVFQYFQSEQLTPNKKESRRLRRILKKDSADRSDGEMSGQEVKSGKGVLAFPVLTMIFAATFPGALALYWSAGSALAMLQQGYILRKEAEEMQKVASLSAGNSR